MATRKTKKRPAKPAASAEPAATLYNRDLAAKICMRLAAGFSLAEICKPPGMPSAATVRSWVIDDVDGFAARHTRAREIQALGWAEEILEIADRKGVDGEHRRAMLDTRKWLVGKVLRKIYGDKVELSGRDGGPIQLSVEERSARVRAVLEALQQPGKSKA